MISSDFCDDEQIHQCEGHSIYPYRPEPKPGKSDPKPSIRPVVVDVAGQIFEMTGERIVMPGLGPQDVLDAIEDDLNGRTRLLKDIVASRNLEKPMP